MVVHQKDTKVLCRNPEGCNTYTRKDGKQLMFADLRSSGLQSHTSFLPWVELICFPRIFCFSDGYQLSFLSSARKRTWPMPAFCHQARARPGLSAVVLRSGETHLVSSTVQEQQVAHVCKHSTGLRRSGGPWAGVGMLPRGNIYDYGQEPWSCYTAVYQGLQSQSAPCMPTPELQL